MVLPTPAHLTWADCEVGVIIHFDMSSFDPSFSWDKDFFNPPPLQAFNPDALDVDSWLQTAAAAGAKYAVMVVKHCSGFCLWPTKAHPYHIGNAPCGGDLVQSFMDACKKHGIRPGLYYNANANCYLGASADRLKAMPNADRQRYFDIVMIQLRELWTNYGELFEIWFDGGVIPVEDGGPDIAALLNELQPNAVVFQGPPGAKTLIHWVGNERGEAPVNCSSIVDYRQESFDGTEEHTYAGNTFGNLWCPGEADTPNRDATRAFEGGWFWREGEEAFIFSGEALFSKYLTAVGRNANFLIGMGIDRHGRFPERDSQAFEAFGEKVRQRLVTPIVQAKVAPGQMEVALTVPETANYLVLQEDIAQGERVTGFRVEHIPEGAQPRTLFEAQIIGHKRIVPLDDVRGGQIRFTIQDCKAAPQLRTVALY